MGLTDSEKRFKFDRRLPVRQVQDNPIYAGMIETMDRAVGVVLNKLKETGLDNGVTAGDHYSTSLLPLRGGKGRQWEGGTSAPVIVRVPGMTLTDSQSDVPVIGMDFYPTILQLAGLPLYLKANQSPSAICFGITLTMGTKVANRLRSFDPDNGNSFTITRTGVASCITCSLMLASRKTSRQRNRKEPR